MVIRTLTPDDAPALLPLGQALAAHHGDTPDASERDLSRDLADGWFWGFGAGEPLVGSVFVIRHAKAHVGARQRGCTHVLVGAHTGKDAARATYEALGYHWSEPTFWRFRKVL